MTSLRRLLHDAGMLKLLKTNCRSGSHGAIKKSGAVDGKRIVAVSASRVELETKKLFAAAHSAAPLPEGLPCHDRTELCSSAPLILSFGMFQNVVYTLSLLCVKPYDPRSHGHEESALELSNTTLSENECFVAVLRRLNDLLHDDKHFPFSPMGGYNFESPNNLPSPFQKKSVLLDYESLGHSDSSQWCDSLGVWQNNVDPVSMSLIYMFCLK